ncbi:acyl-CoA dehydrogenase family protein [Gordonia sp. (in: high G+C Gram-positive bacteria)]|uniref:acyl-CoA dehydrogenase family protein n=1 Tax=Gordonia sp. (in: high G+C Gram-positive bacteria) TaxID=84139 RepID=UPI003F967F8A
MTSVDSVAPTAFSEILADLARGAVDREIADVNPFEQVRAVAAAGFGRLRLPVERGGAGSSLRELFAAIIDVAEADPTVAHIYRTHFWLTEDFLSESGPTADRLLRLVADGNVFGNATSERGGRPAGSQDFSTTLTQDGDSYRLNGEKFYTTGTLFADFVCVWAADGATPTAVVVPTDRAGVQILDDWDGFGQRRTGSGTTLFTDVLVRPDEIVRRADSDHRPPSTHGAFVQLYLHAIVAGILRTVVSDAKALVTSRTRTFSHANSPDPVDDPTLQQVVGELASFAFVAEATVLVAAETLDAAADSAVHGVPDARLAHEAAVAVSKTKVVLDDLGTRAATVLFEVGGASASSRAKDLDRHWRNIRTITLHNPARLKAQAVGADVLTGRPLPANGYF